jgi:glycosyltransferase involved in cell wall biosynthesis
MKKLLAIVPAFNEAGAIAATIADIRSNAPGFDVLVIDDGSTDETSSLARACGALVLSHPFNLGIGGAVQSGYQFAYEHDYDVAVQVDADGQHDAACLPQMLEHLAASPGLNMVTGSRFIESADDGYRSSASRRLGIRIFAAILSVIVGRRVTDPTSGFRMCDRQGISLFARDYPHDYPEVEAVLLLHAHRLRGDEMPVRMRPRTTGRSSIKAPHSVLYMAKVLLAILVGLMRARPVPKAGEEPAVRAEHAI